MPRFTGRVHRRSTKSLNSQRLYYPLCADPILDAVYSHHITHFLLCTCTENDTLSFRLCDLNHEAKKRVPLPKTTSDELNFVF